MTHTISQTTTATRLEAVADQFEWALVRLDPKRGRHFFEKFIEPALEQAVLRGLSFYGLDEHRAQAVLRIRMHWKLHRRRVSASVNFQLPSGWETTVSPELMTSVRHYEKRLKRRNLRSVGFMEIMKGQELLINGEPVARRMRPRLHIEKLASGMPLRDLEELSLMLMFADEEGRD
jgi:hypothetical protein